MAFFKLTIALDPGAGGLCIPPNSLQSGDIIVSTTGAAISGFIRVNTMSPASHTALSLGGNEVVEALSQGVCGSRSSRPSPMTASRWPTAAQA